MLSNEQSKAINYSLLAITINRGKGSKVMQFMQEMGIYGASCLFGKGTIKNEILQLLEMNEVKKEVIFAVIPSEREDEIMEQLNKKFQLYKQNHGIAFSMPLANILNMNKEADIKWGNNVGAPDNQSNYSAVYVIVDKGKAETVIEISQKAGYYGGTIIKAHGSAGKLNIVLDMPVEAEKELVLILTESKRMKQLSTLLYEYFSLKEANTGALYVTDVSKTIGLFQELDSQQEEYKKIAGKSYLIMAKVPLGYSEIVIKGANDAGATGGTLLKARGERTPAKGGLFDFKIEPEEEIVLIMAEQDIAEKICNTIHKDYSKIKKKGVLYIQPIYRMDDNSTMQ